MDLYNKCCEYETLFDVEFWNHLMIIVTGVDDEDDLEEFEEEEHVKDIQQILNDKFEHLKSLNRDIPVIYWKENIFTAGAINYKIPNKNLHVMH